MSEKPKRKWWERSSAVDDGALADDGYTIVEQDDNGDWIDDFRFDDYKADRGLSSSQSIWNRYGDYGSSFVPPKHYQSTMFGGADYATAKKLESAQRLVQGFIDTFALDNPLRARFSSGTTVGGDDGEKTVEVSHRPLLDPSLDTFEAHEIMTAQAANAAARARFGGAESKRRKVALSNLNYANGDEVMIASDLVEILDGYRIDTSFRRDYPGYEDVYAPAQAYVAKGLLGDRERFLPSDFKGASIANAALNYADWTDWSGNEEHRDWWREWADQYANARIDDFTAGIQAALERLREEIPPTPPQPAPASGDSEQDEQDDDDEQDQGDSSSGAGSDGDADPDDDEQDDDADGSGSGEGDDESDEQQEDEDSGDGDGDDDDDDESDDESDGEGSGQSEPSDSDSGDGGESDSSGSGAEQTAGTVDLPSSLGQGVSTTGIANGATALDEDQAQQVAGSAAAMALGLNDNEVGEVYWTANGFRNQSRSVPLSIHPETSANGYIKRAFTRSRTAHYATERGHLTGRIDNRSLPRIASDDYRLFSKRVAPSDTRYRVWLLIDNSGSMSQTRIDDPQRDAANLAASVALALRHVPNVALDIWAWTSGIRNSQSAFSAVRIYADGDPISNIGRIQNLPMGGTPDASTLSWATREILKQRRPDETPVILMASDGQGELAGYAVYRNNAAALRSLDADTAELYRTDRVAEARKKGVKVLSVAIGSLQAETQDLIYGKGNHLLWNGSIKTMAKPLGDLLARIASNKA